MQQYFSILKTKYDQSAFQKFAHELLNDIEIGRNQLEVDKPFQEHIDALTYLGSFTDSQGKNLHILDVVLKTQTKLEQARTMQRNLIARYLKDHWIDGALVAFHSANSSSWRLSLVKVDYKYDDKGKLKEELSGAKRYSFIVGEAEPTHTPESQLSRIYEQTATNPTLAQLEEAFGIEKVTKEFFEKYRGLFETVVAELKHNHTFINEASRNNIDTESFAKKLLGQIVFLYFLQKKGWLGVPKGKAWGEGDKNFLRGLYRKCIENNQNFYNDYLEKLFYDTLNNPRRNEVDPSYSKYFDSRVPFLNGGLFEPPYDWQNSLIYLDNKIFGKIFDVFDLYNFTVKEDEPLEKEVAVDPEMLGKVFENLLEENLRKGKGTYYTPREIVHYMCEESLINYLATETGLTADDVRSKYFPAYNVLGDEKFEVRDVSVGEKIIESLGNIKVVDPACGSGAFLVGMLQQITQLRYELETRSKMLGRRTTASTEYEIKKQTIQNCIYGVDIDPGAVDIAKLRLWLSLVVDYDLEDIEPLPNLDYKIMVGNSLIEKLDTNFLVRGVDRKKNELVDELKELKLNYFESSDPKMKSELRIRINELIRLLINYDNEREREKIWAQILGRKNQMKMFAFDDEQQSFGDIETYTKKLGQLIDVKETDHFEWHLNFNEVFEKDGFDIVIANPPYIRVQNIDKTVKKVYSSKYSSATNNYDIYVLFDELALTILKPDGILSFIQPNKFFSSDYGIGIRDLIGKNGYLFKIVDFGAGQIFDTATTYTCLLFCKKAENKTFQYIAFKSLIISNLFLDYVNGVKNPKVSIVQLGKDYLDPDGWFFGTDEEIALFKKIEEAPSRLKNITDSTFQGVVTSADPIYILEQRDGKIYSPFLKEFIEIEQDPLKPLLKGSDIRRYSNKTNKNWLIFPYEIDGVRPSLMSVETFTSKYPKLWAYLKKCEKKLRNREKGKMDHDSWYAYVYPKNLTQFEKPKIMIQVLSKKAAMTLDMDKGFYFVGGGNAGGYGITLKDGRLLPYILALLNSSLLDYYLQHHSSKFQNGYFSYAKRFIQRIPIRFTTEQTQNELGDLIKKILLLRANNSVQDQKSEGEVKVLESRIDQIVYDLYGLEPDDIQLIKQEYD